MATKGNRSPSEMTRLARTGAQLRPAQVGQRARLRAQRMALEHGVPLVGRWLLAGPGPASATGWPSTFTPLDAAVWRDWPGIKDAAAGEWSLLGVSAVVAPADESGTARWAAADWDVAGTPLLWRFHLYYWDWAWALALAEDQAEARTLFAAMWESWYAAVPAGRGTAWRPYPVALRAWSFCGIYRGLVAGSTIQDAFLADLGAQAGFLRRNLETDVGGNHLIKNLKALTGLAIFYSDDRLLAWALRRLQRQLGVQVLPDGGHYERSPAYHCQVLGDLIDVAGLLRAGSSDPEPAWLVEAIEKMRGWLGVIVDPAGEVPLLNDGFPVGPELLASLQPAALPPVPLVMLRDTGLARAAVGGWHLLADIGLPCPRTLPAHAHADTLTCLVHVDSEPLLVDVGTSTYAAGPDRDRERSTAAHNTVEVDQQNSTEVFGAFRAGRRARVRGVSADASAGLGVVAIQASHDGYRNLRGRPRHHRRWSLRADELRIDDTMTGRGRHRVVVRWHLAPGARLRLSPGGALVTTQSGEFHVSVTAIAAKSRTPARDPPLTATTAAVSAGFCRFVQAPVLACTLHLELPVRISTVWRRADPRQEST
jgi:uncharacterized heparinase superfamily protein